MAIYKLGEIGEFKGGISSLDKNRYDRGIAFVNYMDVFRNISIKKTNKLRLYDATKKEIEKYGCIYGDVFFTASSETPNEIAMSSVWLSNELAIFNGFCKRFRFNKTILLPKYASFLFRGNIFRNEIKSYATGYTRYNISQKDLGNISIFIPKIFEQQQIINIIEQNEKLFSNYPNCVRINKYKNTQSDMKLLIDIIEPIHNAEIMKKTLNNQIKNIEKYLFFMINNEKKEYNSRSNFLAIIKEKIDTNQVEPKSIGYNGFGIKKGVIPKKSKIVKQYDFAIGLISKKIPIGFNFQEKNLGISSAYYCFTSNIPIASWFYYYWIKNNWQKYVKHSSRQGQGFEKDLFLNERILTPTIECFNKYSHIFNQMTCLKNNIEKYDIQKLKIKIIKLFFK